MKKLLLIILLLYIGNKIIANSTHLTKCVVEQVEKVCNENTNQIGSLQRKTNYEAIVRFFKPANGDWGRGVELSLAVEIQKGYLKIGEQTFQFTTTGSQSVAPDGDIYVLYLATLNSKVLDVQINYSPETGFATKIYIIYWDGSTYGYILK